MRNCKNTILCLPTLAAMIVAGVLLLWCGTMVQKQRHARHKRAGLFLARHSCAGADFPSESENTSNICNKWKFFRIAQGDMRRMDRCSPRHGTAAAQIGPRWSARSGLWHRTGAGVRPYRQPTTHRRTHPTMQGAMSGKIR